MAEGGGEDKENPFSFQFFINKKKPPKRDSGDDAEDSSEPDIFDANSTQASSGTHNNTQSGSDNIENTSKKKEESKDENPFSFKKFLNSGTRPKTNGHLISRLDLANDLPDFVQDHFTPHEPPHWASNIRTTSHRLPTDVPLPDFALDSENSDIFSSARSSSHEPASRSAHGLPPPSLIQGLQPPDISQPQGPLGVSDFSSSSPPLSLRNDSDSGTNSRRGSATSRSSLAMDGPEPDLQHIDLPIPGTEPARLPDFLSDSAAGTLSCYSSSQNSERDDSSPNLPFVNGDDSRELNRLQDENRELRRQLKQARSTTDTQTIRIDEITREKERIEKREAEENTALESMVQQVEANLVLTTQRAVAAEGTINKLKQDVKSLQVTVSTLQNENATLKCSKTGNDPVREKALHASEQLAIAAANAEQTLKQLLSGVETIKLMSNVLASVDKITEEGATAGSGPAS